MIQSCEKKKITKDKNINVLVLDDEANILNSVRRLFASEPFQVVTTTDFDEAMSILSTEDIKVVISDQRMPRITGVEFLKQIKERYPDIFRILFTGIADFKTAEDAINISQVHRFINKPWDNFEFKLAVEQAIEHYDLVSENKRLLAISERKNRELTDANTKIKDLYEVQKEFTSTVSHEIRTPLATIKGAIDLVISGTPGPLNNDQINFLEKTKTNIDRLSRLIHDVLDLSRFEDSGMKLLIEENDILKVINQVVEDQRPLAKNKGLNLKIEVDCASLKISFDEDRIVQVLNNIINNALKFTQKGEIVVSCSKISNGKCVEVSVSDTGPGIKKEEFSKIFKKFQQVGNSAHNTEGGAGLGLAICRNIINQHGGEIWVESEFGVGSRFIFSLPISI